MTTALNQLEQTGGRYALCSMCIGVGQGIALIIESLVMSQLYASLFYQKTSLTSLVTHL